MNLPKMTHHSGVFRPQQEYTNLEVHGVENNFNKVRGFGWRTSEDISHRGTLGTFGLRGLR